ncbi:MAG TPA: hypothetical protein DCK95_12930, partial [Anaerolineaceae bacterium]|nr:hypothetical protein [Anaerolineaceae bacterium]
PASTNGSVPAVKTKTLGRLIGAFKTVSTKRINQIRNTPGAIVWQRNYWDHIIRDEKSLKNVRNYIINNPSQWGEDENNPRRKMEYGRQ